jgi:predicted Zn-dependent protease with MMP-like domain
LVLKAFRLMKIEEFEELVKTAIEEMPAFVKEKMDNVAICVEERPTREINRKRGGVRKNSYLLGLYQGVPKNVWGRGFGGNLPDKITIFKEAIEQFAKSDEKIKRIVKRTVYHEIAHHFGFNEKEVRELEKSFNNKN